MSLIGREIEKRIAENKIGKFKQAGFTKGVNILDNLFILPRTDSGNSDRL